MFDKLQWNLSKPLMKRPLCRGPESRRSASLEVTPPSMDQ